MMQGDWMGGWGTGYMGGWGGLLLILVAIVAIVGIVAMFRRKRRSLFNGTFPRPIREIVRSAFARAWVMLVYSWLALHAFSRYVRQRAYATSRVVPVMVITCPPALGLLVPPAVVASTALAARNGRLFRSRVAFERARNIKAILDKTGTLTDDRFGVTDTLVLSRDSGRRKEGRSQRNKGSIIYDEPYRGMDGWPGGRRDVGLDGNWRTGGGPGGRRDHQAVQ